MSGHNPHSRVSQPVNSSSWNHLQVPAYIPRQPQLAHMSNEHPVMHSTPLMWPNTSANPADAYLNFMALQAAAAAANTNHKNVFRVIIYCFDFIACVLVLHWEIGQSHLQGAGHTAAVLRAAMFFLNVIWPRAIVRRPNAIEPTFVLAHTILLPISSKFSLCIIFLCFVCVLRIWIGQCVDFNLCFYFYFPFPFLSCHPPILSNRCNSLHWI